MGDSIDRKLWYRNTYLKSSKWDSIRLEKLVEQDGICSVCESQAWNNDVHHISYARFDKPNSGDLRVLCRKCHSRVHEIMDEMPALKETLKEKSPGKIWKSWEAITCIMYDRGYKPVPRRGTDIRKAEIFRKIMFSYYTDLWSVEWLNAARARNKVPTFPSSIEEMRVAFLLVASRCAANESKRSFYSCMADAPSTAESDPNYTLDPDDLPSVPEPLGHVIDHHLSLPARRDTLEVGPIAIACGLPTDAFSAYFWQPASPL